MKNNISKQNAPGSQSGGIPQEVLREKSTAYIKNIVGKTLKISPSRIDSSEPLEKYGIDSILIVKLTNTMSEVLEDITSTLFFEHQTIDALVKYFMKNQKDSLIKLLGLNDEIQEEEVPTREDIRKEDKNSDTRVTTYSGLRFKQSRRFLQFYDQRMGKLEAGSSQVKDIAIIGISGHYPGARNFNQFWNNLKEGKNSITEIPEDRWDWRKYYDEEKGKTGIMYTKWGGFIEDIDKFDPLFFNISPKEAQMIDPQERLFLESVYESIEDAGYTPAHLCNSRKIGVFVGVMNSDYPNVTKYWSISNRISYLLNFQGPSVTLDTACSSSLTAIHLALESLYSGISECAIAGGVNLIVDPIHYLKLSEMAMLTPGNKCKSFGENADGFVASEGVGAIVLKPLEKAVDDRDHIYGIIKGSMINAAGKTNGYTVPNPVAQGELILEAFKRAKVNPRTISYIEAHGTGTALGDPIEIAGLNKAFREYTQDTRFCAIGSAKSNIGHCESAAGIAGITKILLQLKHRLLAPSLHSGTLNPEIDFKKTPFTVVQELKEWKRPVINLDGESKEYPLIAGISSFGAGGSNAHIIIEEYVPQELEQSDIRINAQNPAIILLSAKNDERLKEKAQRLLAAIEENHYTESNLPSIAYTLQTGREDMEERVALIVTSLKELEEKLKSFVLGQHDSDDLFQGHVRHNKESLAVLKADDDMQSTINAWIAKKKYSKLAELWAKGMVFDWNMLYGNVKPVRISLPTYPFARERYWIPGSEAYPKCAAGSVLSGYIHPLLHQNTSDLMEQRFTSVFSGDEFFLKDHVINGRMLLPGAAFLEMTRAALLYGSGVLNESSPGIRLKNIAWMSPVVVGNEGTNVHISLFLLDNGEIGYEAYGDPVNTDGEAIMFYQGDAVLGPKIEVPVLDIQALRAEYSPESIDITQFYDTFKKAGINYGPSNQCIKALYAGQDKILARLALHPGVINTQELYGLHPGLMDSALHAAAGLLMHQGTSFKPALPFAVDEVEIIDTSRSPMWVLVRYNDINKKGGKIEKFDIDVCDEAGAVCIRIKGFATRVMGSESESFQISQPIDTLMLSPYPEEKPLSPGLKIPEYSLHVVMLCEMETGTSDYIGEQIKGVRCISLESKENALDKRYEIYTVRAFEEIRNILKDKPKSRVLVQIIVPMKDETEVFLGLSGLLKTAGLENPQFCGQIIGIEQGNDLRNIAEIVKMNTLLPEDNEIRYQLGKRYVTRWNEMKGFKKDHAIPWKDRGVYLITGGSGSLGLIFAGEIVQKARDTTLILTDLFEPGDNRNVMIDLLRSMGGHVEFIQADISQKTSVKKMIQGIKKDFGSLNGIIHTAGLVLDNFIVKKSVEDIQKVLAPKVSGLLNLDEATKDMDLDFFILFSSYAGIMGNIGQADYAAANSFMDYYAVYRNKLISSQQRKGHTLSVNWPFWKDGGMLLNEETKKMMKDTIGMVPMESSTGISAVYNGLSAGTGRMMVFEGDKKQLYSSFIDKKADATGRTKKDTPSINHDLFKEKAIDYLKTELSSIIGLPPDRIDTDVEFENYGIDSVMIMKLNNQLEKTFGSLSKTLFFEYRNIAELTDYFLESYEDRLIDFMGLREKKEDDVEPDSQGVDTEKTGDTSQSNVRKKRGYRFSSISREQKENIPLDIAIIGLSGRFPQSRDINEFWKNLREGKDCITEIPADRWDYNRFFDEDKNKIGKTNTKWGGFLEGADQFDPLFFNISPLDAGLMDPQERLFLQCVYETLEDAGYTRETIGVDPDFGLNGNVGVFAGVMYDEYQLYGAEETLKGRPIALSGISASVANRVSYFLNLHGPSMTVNSMCSSSLTTIHLACQSLTRGECNMAVAGGVNLSLHPNKYLTLGQNNFASSKGRCESFGEGGDGYVPGEGVGAILLKPLSKAVADEDHIYGIIKGTAINHGGKTNGYTVPNPHAQADVISKAFKEAGINPRTVSYIEAHGTGTLLGDPIEITGLNKAFREYSNDRHFCAIGSVKSNIGHSESAAGIAGVAKILLQLKNRAIVPSLHSSTLNPNIDFENTPFVVAQELSEWKRPMIELNGENKEYPRIAGISSFGAGGSNAHVIIQEYIPQETKGSEIIITKKNPAIIVLSAKDEERLKEYAQRLYTAIDEKDLTNISLADIAFTLQVGREAMDERLAVIAASITELSQKLKDFVQGQPNISGLFRGQAKQNSETLSALKADEDMETIIEAWIAKSKHAKLADLWVRGLVFDWNRIYGEKKPKRISLPTYPFARDRYWIPDIYDKDERVTGSVILDKIHPLLHQNTSDLIEQRFTSIFSGREFFLKDHVVHGQVILPGVVYLEMARAAVENASGLLRNESTAIILKDVVWIRPVVLEDQDKKIHISLFVKENDEIGYEIYEDTLELDTESVMYYQGSALLRSIKETSVIDLKALQAECSQESIDIDQYYNDFKKLSIDYGSSLRGIEALYLGSNKVLASLSIPADLMESQDAFMMHPSIMDSALQAAAGMMLLNGGSLKPILPFAVEQVEIFERTGSSMWTVIRYSDKGTKGDKVESVDIDICDESGTVCIRMKGFSSRILDRETDIAPVSSTIGTLMLAPYREEMSIPEASVAPFYGDHVVFLCELESHVSESVASHLDDVRTINLESGEKDIAKRFEAYTVRIIDEIRQILIEKPKDNVLVQIVVLLKDESQLFLGLSGILKTAHLENPKLIGQIIGVEKADFQSIIDRVTGNRRSVVDNEVHYRQGKRYIHGWKEIEGMSSDTQVPWKEKGVYLITGGAGGLGSIFAAEIGSKVKQATIILAGRSPLNADKKTKIDELRKSGAGIEYRQVDITDMKATSALIDQIISDFGNLNGIIHSAGVILDNLIITKTSNEVRTVLAPKTGGLINLDAATKDLNLDFFILFSSLAGVIGNVAQADYATANAFMDNFAVYRNNLVSLKKRNGHTLSINWPLWKQGGMQINKETEKMMIKNLGMQPMQNSTGIEALYISIASGNDRVLVCEGDKKQLNAL
ncbi:MAG: SDR family NAD(P)-dependent oxidoreductase, partial [Spirochaetales bacterium]|nr:SDR family NAD(P)-dependent oxidoreductase [Spirochaetales bacterium]